MAATSKAPPHARARSGRGGAAPARRPTRVGSTVGSGRRRKPTLTADQLAGRLSALLPEFPTILRIWGTPTLDPAFREELMVAVARFNEAPYCDWAHSTWAESAGASRADIAKIGRRQVDGLDRRTWVATAFVRALASTDFKHPARELRREMTTRHASGEIRDIELVAKVMDLVNRIANTYEAMLSRLQGKPRAHTDAVDELVASGVFLGAAPLIVFVLSRYTKRTFLDTTRSLIDHVQHHYAREARG